MPVHNPYNNSFFTKDIYEHENNLTVDDEMMEGIFEKNPEINQQHIGFVFITDLREKALDLKSYILEKLPCYTDLSVNKLQELWEISGNSCNIKMAVKEINIWNQKMWDLGYQFDCILDGWQINNV